MPGQKNLMERRATILSLMAAGVPPAKIVEQVVAQHDVSPNTAWRDWKHRSQWMPHLLNLKESAENTAIELIATLRTARQELFKIGITAGNENAKVGAIREISANIGEEVKLRQILGQLPTPAQKVDASVSGVEVVLKGWGLNKDAPATDADAEERPRADRAQPQV